MTPALGRHERARPGFPRYLGNYLVRRDHSNSRYTLGGVRHLYWSICIVTVNINPLPIISRFTAYVSAMCPCRVNFPPTALSFVAAGSRYRVKSWFPDDATAETGDGPCSVLLKCPLLFGGSGDLGFGNDCGGDALGEIKLRDRPRDAGTEPDVARVVVRDGFESSSRMIP